MLSLICLITKISYIFLWNPVRTNCSTAYRLLRYKAMERLALT